MVRMTSKERLQKLADEAVAGEELKAEKKKAAPKKRATKKSVAAKRYKAVWKVLDAGYKEAACFPYSEKDEAYAKAEKLNQKKGNNNYFVNEIKVPMEE
jgi:phage gp16-like protein